MNISLWLFQTTVFDFSRIIIFYWNDWEIQKHIPEDTHIFIPYIDTSEWMTNFIPICKWTVQQDNLYLLIQHFQNGRRILEISDEHKKYLPYRYFWALRENIQSLDVYYANQLKNNAILNMMEFDSNCRNNKSSNKIRKLLN